MLSANGTIFTYEHEGVIPGLLTKWYSNRKISQRKLSMVSELVDGISVSGDLLMKIDASKK
jgi:hypothetical protein